MFTEVLGKNDSTDGLVVSLGPSLRALLVPLYEFLIRKPKSQEPMTLSVFYLTYAVGFFTFICKCLDQT